MLIVDEWESPEAFQAFFDAEGANIGQVMGAAGMQSEQGAPSFYQKLSLGDQF